MIYTIFGGVNGAGKSTIFNMLDDEEKDKLGIRINVDELVANRGDWTDNKLQFEASKQIVKSIKECINNKNSFNQETTLSGRSIVTNIIKAKEIGFEIELYYVYVDNVEIAKERVIERVKNGGHGVPEDLIEKRYIKSLENLKLIIPMCDKVSIFSNTTVFNEVVSIVNGEVTQMINDLPEFIINAILDNN